MITWSEAIRKKDSTHFCRLAIEEAEPQKVWLVVDARRKSDMNFFKSHYSVQAASPSQACEGNKGVGVLTVRIEADQEMRQTRGWVFTPGIDDAPSECGLDHYACDITISNNHHSQQLNQQLTVIIEWIKDKLELIIKDWVIVYEVVDFFNFTGTQELGGTGEGGRGISYGRWDAEKEIDT